MESLFRTLPAAASALLFATAAGPAWAAPMATASLVLRSDGLAWGQRLDALAPGSAPTKARTLTSANGRATTLPAVVPGTALPINARPITGVLEVPQPPAVSPPPGQIQSAAATPASTPSAAAVRVEEPTPEWLQSLQSWIMGIARSIGN